MSTDLVQVATISEADVDASIARVIQNAESIWDEWAWQVENKTWLVKGYASWDEMRRAVYGGLTSVTAPRSERPELVARFRNAGLTQQETADTLGVSQQTVSNHDEPRQAHPARSTNFGTSASDDAVDAEVVDDFHVDTETGEITEEPTMTAVTGLDGKTYTRAPRQQRAAQIESLSDKGHTSAQIAHRLGIGVTQVRKIAQEAGVTIQADVVRGKRIGLDSNRILNNVAESVAAAAFSIRQINAAELDMDDAQEWVDSLTESLKTLRGEVQSINKAIKESFQ